MHVFKCVCVWCARACTRICASACECANSILNRPCGQDLDTKKLYLLQWQMTPLRLQYLFGNNLTVWKKNIYGKKNLLNILNEIR